jgi:hypothetical protein
METNKTSKPIYFEFFNPFIIYKRRHSIIHYFRSIPDRLWVNVRFELAKRDVFISANERKIKKLKNKHVGKRCFIIGNGPSLKVEDLNKLDNEITFASNKIYLAFEHVKWRPTYYVVVDKTVARQNYDVINKIEGTIKLLPSVLNSRDCPCKADVYFRARFSYHTHPPPFSRNLLDVNYYGGMVIYNCIQIAYFMGIKEVYLIGVDFHFNIPEKEKDGRLVAGDVVNHFHPDYRKPGELWSHPRLEYSEEALLVAKIVFNESDREIYNATRGGKLEIFPRVEFDDLF